MIERLIKQDILEGAKHFGVVAILGPRQSGKTTLAKALFPRHKYVNFEHIGILQLALNDPVEFLKSQGGETGLIIDEFQNAPQILSYIQLSVDENRRPGYFILTGSQNFLMNQAISQSLAGRISLHTLLPLSISELKHAELLPDRMEELVYQGSYPPFYAHGITPDRWYPHYVQTYVERDVRQLQNVGDLGLFKTFLMLCSGRIGQILNYTSLGNDCGISDNTVRKWISVLEASYILFLVYPFHENSTKRAVKSPKLYFYDTGLASFLQGLQTPEQVASSYLRGNLFENLIITDFLKQHYNHGKIPHIYFWRDYQKKEVDCIINLQKRIPVEIKANRTINPAFFDGLINWSRDTQSDPKKGYVVYTGDENQQWPAGKVISWKMIDTILE